MNAGRIAGETRLGRPSRHAGLLSDELRNGCSRRSRVRGDTPQHDDMTLILLKIEPVAAVPGRRPVTAELAKDTVSASRG